MALIFIIFQHIFLSEERRNVKTFFILFSHVNIPLILGYLLIDLIDSILAFYFLQIDATLIVQ